MSESWSDGYATELDYTFGCYPELNPLRVALILLLDGHEPPPPGPCCELGFGQGVSLAMHAAGDPAARWWGTDLLPAHARNARRLLADAGVGAVAAAEDFATFCARPDLPEFSFIGLHGIWSWVSEANRQTIVDFVRRRLAPGGVLYTGCNVLPGWAPSLPLRQLLRDHMRLAGRPDEPAETRVQRAVAFVQQVYGVDSASLAATPGLREQAQALDGMPAAYLLGEYMNRDWAPMAFTEIAERLAAAQLTHAASADLLDRLHGIQLSPPQIELMADIGSPALRQSVQDLFRGRRFRRDLWVRGGARLGRLEQFERLQDLHVVLAVAPEDVPRSIPGAVGEAELQADAHAVIVDALAGAAGALPISALFDRLADQEIDLEAGLGVVSILVGAHALSPAHPPSATQAARPATERLNAQLLRRAPSRVDVPWLASPVTGGGVRAPATLQLLLCARRERPAEPEAWPAWVWATLQDSGQPLLHEGERIVDDDAALARLGELARNFQRSMLPTLQRLQVVD